MDQDSLFSRPANLTLECRLSSEDAASIAARQSPFLDSDRRILQILKGKIPNLERALKTRYDHTLESTTRIQAGRKQFDRKLAGQENGKPALHYHPFGWMEYPTHFCFSDLFTKPQSGTLLQRIQGNLVARKIMHPELDGFTALCPSEEGISESALAANMSKALCLGYGHAKVMADPKRVRPVNHPSGNQGIIFYPIWEVPRIETYSTMIPVTVSDSSLTHQRTLEARCTTTYEAVGATFVDGVSGKVYYQTSSHSYFNRNRMSDPVARLTIKVTDSSYITFRKMSDEETTKEAEEYYKKNHAPRQGDYDRLEHKSALTDVLLDKVIPPDENHDIHSRARDYVSLHSGVHGCIVGSILCGILGILGGENPRGVGFLVGVIPGVIIGHLYGDYKLNREVKRKKIEWRRERNLSTPFSMGQQPDPYTNLIKNIDLEV